MTATALPPQDSRLQIVSQVTETDYDGYLNLLKEHGMDFYLDNTIGSDRAAAFLSDGRNYHLRLLLLLTGHTSTMVMLATVNFLLMVVLVTSQLKNQVSTGVMLTSLL